MKPFDEWHWDRGSKDFSLVIDKFDWDWCIKTIDQY